MNRIKVKMLTAILFISMLFLASIGFSQRPDRPHKPPFFRIEAFADELELTDAQITQIKHLRFDKEKKAIELHSKIKLIQLELRELKQSDVADLDKIKQKIEAIGDLKSELQFSKVQGNFETKKILTAEQTQKLKELKKERKKSRKQRRRPPRQR